jgi:hypothetical protein
LFGGYQNWKEKDVSYLVKQYNWKGSGRKDDPYIISNANLLSNKNSKLNIEKSQLYIHFKHINVHSLVIIDSRNVIIEGCSISNFSVSGENNTIRDCKLTTFGFTKAEDNLIEGCTIHSLILFNTHNNTFRKCKIEKVRSLQSKGNVFNDNEISAKFQKELMKETVFFKEKIIIISFLVGMIIFTSFSLFMFSMIHIKSNFVSMIIILANTLIWLDLVLFLSLRFIKKRKLEVYPSTLIN